MLRLSQAAGRVPRGSMTARASRRAAFFGISALLCAGRATVTAVWCLSMTTMGEIPMAGGWTMSMAWLPMCGQSWAGAAASFLGMWVVMMAAMMLPSLAPTLWRCYRTGGGARPAAPGPAPHRPTHANVPEPIPGVKA